MVRTQNGAYNVRHAPAAVDQNRLDSMCGYMGSGLLETVWAAEFFVLLRSGEFIGVGRFVAGELLDFFLAGDGTALVSKSIYIRLVRGLIDRKTLDRRQRIYVRSACAVVRQAAQPFSRGDAAAAAVGNLAAGVRRAGMEISDPADLDCGSHQLFLATAV